MSEKKIREWLITALAKSGKTQAYLAELLDIDPGQVSRMLARNIRKGSKPPRKLSGAEMLKVAEDLRVDLPGHNPLQPQGSVGGILVRGRLAETAWVTQDTETHGEQRVAAILHPRYPIEQQSSFKVDQPALPGEEYQTGDAVIAVPFCNWRSEPLPDDVIVVRRLRGDLENFTLRKAVLKAGRLMLLPVLVGARENEADPVELHALVIGFQRFKI